MATTMPAFAQTVIPGERRKPRGKGTQVNEQAFSHPPGFPSPRAAMRRSAGNDNLILVAQPVENRMTADKGEFGPALEFAAFESGVAGARMQRLGVDDKGLAFVQQHQIGRRALGKGPRRQAENA